MRVDGGSLTEVLVASFLLPIVMSLIATTAIPGLRTIGRLYDRAVVNAQLVRLDTLTLRAARRVRQPTESDRVPVRETLRGVSIGFLDGDEDAHLAVEQTSRGLRLDIDGERHEFSRLQATGIVVVYRPLPHLRVELERIGPEASSHTDSRDLTIVAPFASLAGP